jgi:hypothetical protein
MRRSRVSGHHPVLVIGGAAELRTLEAARITQTA